MITSKSNELIKHIKALHLKKERDESGEFVVEGIKMVKEAIDSNFEISVIVICEELFSEKIDTNNNKVEYVSEPVFKIISDTTSPQGILAVLKKKAAIDEINESTIFALDGVQDPGNLGTIIRTLDCTGINTLLLSPECADPYNSKVIRSTMGAIFRVNILDGLDLHEKLKELKSVGYNIIVTALDADYNLFDYGFEGKNIVVIGNESKGVSKEIQELANVKIIIPMVGKTESLNAGVAASLAAYESLRKRR